MQESVENMLSCLPATFDKQCTIIDFESSDVHLDLKVAKLMALNHVVIVRNFQNGPLLNWDRDTLFDIVRSPGSLVNPLCMFFPGLLLVFIKTFPGQKRRTREEPQDHVCSFDGFINEANNLAVCLDLRDYQTDRFGPENAEDHVYNILFSTFYM